MKYFVLIIRYTDFELDYEYEYNVGIFDDESLALLHGQKLSETKFSGNHTFDYWTNGFVLNTVNVF